MKIFIHPDYPANVEKGSQQYNEQMQIYESSLSHFHTEKKYLSELKHKNIVKIYEN